MSHSNKQVAHGVQERVTIVGLGCARNDTDSEELAGRLAADGWRLTEDAEDADVVLVNTCAFVESAKQESIDTLLDAADLRDAGAGPQRVVAVGCLSERYGSQLQESLSEVDAVLGFDSYPQIGTHLRSVLDGAAPAAHEPRDRRLLLPVTPVDRQAARGPASGPRPVRERLSREPVAPLKIAGGCDRRCSFCAIPSFRGPFVSRRPAELLAEARWLASDGVREILLVSENTTSYGKDLGDLRLLESLLPELAAIDGLDRVRLSYLQPAEMRDTLISAIASTPGVVPYFDLSFQHASGPLLRRMRRFGSRESFLRLLADVRSAAPDAGVRTNVIVGFPGETEADLAELERFLDEARLDAVGVFGYSDEDGTEAETLPDKVPAEVIAERVERIASLVDVAVADRAAERVGDTGTLLVDAVMADGTVEGRLDHQGPDSDGSTTLRPMQDQARPGDLIAVRIVGSDGADLIAEPARLDSGG